MIRYTIEFDFDGDHYITEKNTGYYLKSPINYTPVDFVDRQEMEDYVDEAVSAATSGMATEEYVQGIVSALPIDSCVLKVNADATQLATSDEEIRRFYDALDRGELNRCYITTSSNPPSRWSSIWDSNRLYTGGSTFGDSSGYTFNFYFRLQDKSYLMLS